MTPSLTPQATDAVVCTLLITGRAECRARFEHGSYQLVLCREGAEERLDLGFSGSRLLERLLRTPGQVVSRDELLQYAWEDRVVSQGSLNQQVYTLRQMLFDASNQIIQTLPRRGYLFNPAFIEGPAMEQAPAAVPPHAEPVEAAVVQALPEITPMAVEAEATVVPLASPAPVRRGWSRAGGLLAGSALAILLAVATLGMRLWDAPAAPHSRSVGLGDLQVLYIDKTPLQLERLVSETRQLVSALAGMSTRPARLIVNASPGFYEIRCLRDDGRINWLKVHHSQLHSVPDAQLQGCLQ